MTNLKEISWSFIGNVLLLGSLSWWSLSSSVVLWKSEMWEVEDGYDKRHNESTKLECGFGCWPFLHLCCDHGWWRVLNVCDCRDWTWQYSNVYFSHFSMESVLSCFFLNYCNISSRLCPAMSNSNAAANNLLCGKGQGCSSSPVVQR